ncbi:RING finger protein 150-like [Littorina saxatilis]|uniref:PA domain-containing protein n=1 Tax=Littorina saxatilis TaxID=31220 RepID=A0AAN9B2A5_9CAEN
MELALLTALLLVLCVRGASCARTCQIEAELMDPVSMVKHNSSYYFGIYGKSSLRTAVSGHLVHVRSEENENHGCSDYTHDLPDHDWVALVERGQCYFTEKIRVATKQYNASAIIVYDNAPTMTLVSMNTFVEDEVYLFVKQSFGRRLALLADSGMHAHVTITAVDSNDALPAVTAASASLLCWTLLLCVALLWP